MRRNHDEKDRKTLLQMAVHLQLLSIGWIMVEAVLAAVAANASGSLSLSAFSVESAIELITALTLAVRLLLERLQSKAKTEALERAASGVVGACLLLLTGYVALATGKAIAVHPLTEVHPLGVLVALSSVLITPLLARQKRRLGHQLHSHALLGDAACNMTCAYMSLTLLLGLALNWILPAWWVDSVAAMGIIYFVQREAWRSLWSAWSGEAHSHAH